MASTSRSMVRRGRSGAARHPAGAGGLQPEREHVDHEQQAHDGGEGAVLRRTEQPGGQDGEAVGRHVHDAHRDGDRRHSRGSWSCGSPGRICTRKRSRRRRSRARAPLAGWHGPKAPESSVRRVASRPGRSEEEAWARGETALVRAWAVLLAVLLLGPALGPGYVLSYDMVWVPDLALAAGLPRARVGAAARGPLRRPGRGARRGRPGDAAAEGGAARQPGRRRRSAPRGSPRPPPWSPGSRRCPWSSGTPSWPSGC